MADVEVEYVAMTHPDVDASASATRDAFEQVWKSRGWVENDGPPLFAPPVPSPLPEDLAPPPPDNPPEEVE